MAVTAASRDPRFRPIATDEWDELRNHPNVGVSLLGKINFLSEVKPYVQSQKERWDGSGSCHRHFRYGPHDNRQELHCRASGHGLRRLH